MTTLPSIPIAMPLLGEAEVDAAARVIRSGWVTQGPEVEAFEAEFAEYVGAAHACAVSNCTTALHLALLAVGVSPGDEVITVSHTFIATANAVRYCGAVPVFVDIEADGFNIDPELIAAAMTPRTRAIVCVHQLGMPCDLGTILPIARHHGIPVVEDAACATGSEILFDDRWQRIGRPHGDIACFSFHPRKVVTTGDGGMLTTSDPKLDASFRLLRQHAMSVSDTVRHAAGRVIFESYSCLGYNYRLTDMQAAIGRQQLRRLGEIIPRRRELASIYAEKLGELDDLVPPREPVWARSNWQSYCVRLPDGMPQLQFMQHLMDLGISTRRGVMNVHLEGAGTEVGRLGSTLARSEAAQVGCVMLPLFAQMKDDEVVRVVDALTVALERCRPVSETA
ncbi:DegT/DnrJ/EryC1/StrS family aminotransferase [Pelagibacterium sp. H642]|uniref:DegT/DnrJ/EryC1/StrS family aminotransferase n=1 Tax=Pelagibacterium sp. H642 TaxID=1881069 RepID=UPI002814E282|nr:DegT/DnrJ/EryC1/StrS family aminotransferase [Pelagibacterium sp. H642]WMT92837.1 DegT/DnrJ/EryC1/StrS family aminotransferase [Pelagibacterium sp. H642]